MPNSFFYRTTAGTFRITPKGQLWELWFEAECLGRYNSPTQASYEAGSGVCDWPSAGDPQSLGVPEELEDWSRS